MTNRRRIEDERPTLTLEELDGVAGGASAILTQNVGRGANGWFHQYSTLSPPLPSGTSWEQANSALQRFNAPTADVMHDRANDPNATSAWVSDPTGTIGVGRVSVEHGDGWVTNQTEFPHPFEGQITRQLIANEDGSYQVLTTGSGEGGYDRFAPPIIGAPATEIAQAVGHSANAEFGPGIFSDVDDHMIGAINRENAVAHGAEVYEAQTPNYANAFPTASPSAYAGSAYEGQYTNDLGGAYSGYDVTAPSYTADVGDGYT